MKNETIVSNSFSKSAEKTIDISVGNITAASGAQLSSDVANLINSSDTKITAYLPETEAKYNINTGDLIKNLSDYYDLDFLIEVPINASQTYKVRLHFDAELKQVDGKDISYVYWPTSRMIKGE